MKNLTRIAPSKLSVYKVPAKGSGSQTETLNDIPGSSKPSPVAAAMKGGGVKIPLVPFWVRNNDPTLCEFEIF